MFEVNDLDREEVVMETTTSVKDSATPTTYVTEDESVKPKVVVQEQEMSTTIPAAATIVITDVPTSRAKGIVFHEKKQSKIPTVSSLKDKAKAKMIEPEVPLKKKDKMRIDEEYVRKLQAKEQEATRLSMAQQDEEANNSWDNIQAMMDGDRLLAERLQAREREELFEVQKARLSPTIIDYKIHKKGKKNYFKIIRADGNSQVYQTSEKIFKNFNREDLEVMWAIVKDRFKKDKPVDDMDNILFKTHKTMFEHHIEDTIWKYQQGLAKVHPLIRNTLHQLWSDVRLQVDYDVEMAYDLL
nr:hypothetical protein [Tanacetum cinerariifolium]